MLAADSNPRKEKKAMIEAEKIPVTGGTSGANWPTRAGSPPPLPKTY